MLVDPMALRLLTVIQAMRIHLRTRGKMRLTRVAKPTLLLSVASEFTGKTYTRSSKGMRAALADLEKLLPPK